MTITHTTINLPFGTHSNGTSTMIFPLRSIRFPMFDYQIMITIMIMILMIHKNIQ